MVGEATEKKLYDAASKGDLHTFQQVLQEDSFLLDVVSFVGSRNLLHIATIWGQAAIVEELLRIHPRLARTLDSHNLTALHISAAQGNLEITKKLLRVASEMCWWRDSHGMNPVHVAAVNGHVEILQELIAVDSFPAMEKVECGHTVLHLCVKHRQLRALEFLVGKLDEDFVNVKNDAGETSLHLAARYKEISMTKFLAKNTKIEKQSVDSTGRTAWDMVKGIPRNTTTYSEMRPLLTELECLNVPTETHESLRKFSEGLIVLEGLIAAMAFQAAISPPGGVWQEDSSTHNAGEAVMASTHPTMYREYLHASGTAFLSSLITILLLIKINLYENTFFVLGVVYLMGASMSSIATCYDLINIVITPINEFHSVSDASWGAASVSLVAIGFVSVGLCFRNQRLRSVVAKFVNHINC